MDAITTLSEQAIKERYQFFIYQTFESRLKRGVINLSKKYSKKEEKTVATSKASSQTPSQAEEWWLY
jgi:hypothetical protein